MLKAINLKKKYQDRTVVKEVSLEIERGEIVGLLGPNGAGKTTIFYSIMGIIEINGGKVFLDDMELTPLPLYKRARMGIGYLAQEPSIFRGLTVEENIDAVLEFIVKDKYERVKKRDFVIKELGLERVRKSKSLTLSGGEKRRLEVARVLATEPKFLLLDEPFVGVDPKAIDDLQNIIWNLKNKDIGILITDHNVRDTLEVIDRAYIIYEGEILFKGQGHELLKSRDVRKFYLGEAFKI